MGNKGSTSTSNMAYSPLDFPEGNGICFFGKHIPHEALRHILSFVPAKDLILFATRVCKQWYDLLSDPHFWIHKLQVDGVNIPIATRSELTREADPSKGLIILRMICSGYLPGDRNLIKNPSGAEKFSHWTVTHAGDGLIVESSPVGSDSIPEVAGLSTQHCFVSSYGTCQRQQIINLRHFGLTPMVLSKLKPKFLVSEWVSARFDCQSESKLTVDFVGKSSTKSVKLEWSSEADGVALREWYEVKATVTTYPSDLYKIVYTNFSSDRQFWAGFYGAKTAGSSVKLLL